MRFTCVCCGVESRGEQRSFTRVLRADERLQSRGWNDSPLFGPQTITKTIEPLCRRCQTHLLRDEPCHVTGPGA
jgi:hypothetical protein